LAFFLANLNLRSLIYFKLICGQKLARLYVLKYVARILISKARTTASISANAEDKINTIYPKYLYFFKIKQLQENHQ
jgi:hypothetical protein